MVTSPCTKTLGRYTYIVVQLLRSAPVFWGYSDAYLKPYAHCASPQSLPPPSLPIQLLLTYQVSHYYHHIPLPPSPCCLSPPFSPSLCCIFKVEEVMMRHRAAVCVTEVTIRKGAKHGRCVAIRKKRWNKSRYFGSSLLSRLNILPWPLLSSCRVLILSRLAIALL